jgi:hypothetical protein
MRCDLDLDYRCSPHSNDNDWVVCTSVAFMLDSILTAAQQDFCLYNAKALADAPPGLFDVLNCRDPDGIPVVEYRARSDYRWMVWVGLDAPHDTSHEWMLWKALDVAAARGPKRTHKAEAVLA